MSENERYGDLLVRADSITSLVAYRHGSTLSADVRAELLAVSSACRKLSEAARDRDVLAVLVAERWWPNRYIGDLSSRDWERVYEAMDGPYEIWMNR